MKKFLNYCWVSLLGVVLLAGGGYAYYLYDSVKDTASDMHEPISRETSTLRTEKVEYERKRPDFDSLNGRR